MEFGNSTTIFSNKFYLVDILVEMMHYIVILFVINILNIALSDDFMKCSSSDETNVQIIGKQVISNGCSKPAWIAVQGEEDFTYCCDRHDACYSMCGSAKVYCDMDFEMCMKRMCLKNFKNNPDCSGAANMYAAATKMLGAAGYSQSQNDYCTCVDSSQVLTHYAQVIDKFYDNFVEESRRKDGKALVTSSKYSKNSGTSERPRYDDIYRIVYNLHKKYDHSIGHEDTRVGKTPPRPESSSKEDL